MLGLNDDIASRWGPRIVVLLSQVAAETEGASGVVVTATAATASARGDRRAAGRPTVRGPGVRHTWVPMVVAAVLMVVISMVALCVGPVAVPPSQVVGTLLAHVPLLHFHTSTPAIDQAIVWQLRAPRVVLAGRRRRHARRRRRGLPGPVPQPAGRPVPARCGRRRRARAPPSRSSTAATRRRSCRSPPSSAARWPSPPPTSSASPGGRRAWGRSIVLAGVAVAALLTAIQTYLQQRDAGADPPDLRLDPRQLLRGIVVRRDADPALRRGVGRRAAGPPAHARRAARGRGGGRARSGIHPARTRLDRRGGGHARAPRRRCR